MEKTKTNEIIIVKQLPIIEEQLKTLSDEIDVRVANATSLVVSEDTVKEVKKVRADLNADFKELENQRKLVKEKVLAPYMAFEEVYKKYVSDKFKDADNTLKIKIDEVEKAQKEEKEKEVRSYYEEYAESLGLGWLNEDKYYMIANINITLSASMKSLKESAKAFIDKTESDLKLIDTQEHKDEIIVEYQKDLNVSKSITEVTDRYKRLEEIEKQKIQAEEIKRVEESVVKKVEKIIKPAEVKVEEKLYELNFKVVGTKEQLKKLKDFLVSEGISYE